MRVLKDDPRRRFVFMDDSMRRMVKFSGDEVQEEDIRRFEIPEFLLEPIEKEKKEKMKPWWERELGIKEFDLEKIKEKLREKRENEEKRREDMEEFKKRLDRAKAKLMCGDE